MLTFARYVHRYFLNSMHFIDRDSVGLPAMCIFFIYILFPIRAEKKRKKKLKGTVSRKSFFGVNDETFLYSVSTSSSSAQMNLQ